MELQVVEELRRQNEELRNEVRALNEKIAQGQNHRGQTPTPRTPTTAMFTPMEQSLQVRRIPGVHRSLQGHHRRHRKIYGVNYRKFHLGHGRSLSMGARRRNGRVGNVDNVNDMNEVVKYMSGPMECWGQMAAYIVKNFGGGGHRQGGPDRGVHPRWHELCEGQGHDDFGKDYIPPPPPVRAEEKKPEGGKTNFDWGANNPEVLVKEEMKDDLRAINVTLPKLPDESAPQAALRCGGWITEIEPLIGWWSSALVDAADDRSQCGRMR